MLICVSTITAWHVLTINDHAHLWVDYHRLARAYHGSPCSFVGRLSPLGTCLPWITMLICGSTITAWHVLTMDHHAHLWVDYHRLACAYHGSPCSFVCRLSPLGMSLLWMTMLICGSTIAAWHVLTINEHAHLWVDYHRLARAYHGSPCSFVGRLSPLGTCLPWITMLICGSTITAWHVLTINDHAHLWVDYHRLARAYHQ